MTVGAVCNRVCMDCARGFLFPPRAFFVCLKQEGQDVQDGQDRAAHEGGATVVRDRRIPNGSSKEVKIRRS